LGCELSQLSPHGIAGTDVQEQQLLEGDGISALFRVPNLDDDVPLGQRPDERKLSSLVLLNAPESRE
jgi:hypothetical protein